MQRISVLLSIASVLFASAPSVGGAQSPRTSTDSVTVIHAATMLDGRGGSVRNAWVVVRGRRIDRVSTAPVTIAGARVVELGSATLLPGLIDAHLHPGWYVDRQGKRNSARSGDTPAQAALARAGNLHATLIAGFTTIQSIGGPEDLELRAATDQQVIPGPRVLTSLAPINNARLTADSLRGVVRALKAEGADVIKLFASSGLGAGGAQTLSDEQLSAICGEAKSLGLRTVVHAISAGSVRASVLAGCTQIEHGIFVTDVELTLMAERGTIFDPQVCLVFQNYVDHPAAYDFTDATLAPLKAALPTASAMFTRAVRTPRLKLVFGTDAVALAHGRNADELLCRVRAGQTPMAAIVSATSAGAEALGLGDRIGTIRAGYEADLIATESDPSRDIAATKRVVFVMRAGTRYR